MDDCGSRSKQLEQLLSEYQSRLQLLDEDSDFAEVHSFGPYNFHQEHNKFKGLLNGIFSRCKQCKSWSNSTHAVKTFVDRQQQVKHLMPIKTYIAECLDKIQGVIRENNLTDTIHRLELITRQVGLKFDVSTKYTECFISSDMFYVEVQLEDNGNILEVKVQHYGDLVPVTCPALTAILRRRDYAEFLKHMQGLANLYRLTGDAFQKSKIFQALVTLEKDLEKIACSDGQKLFEESILGGPVGFLTPRRGQLMHLTYFATPLELRSENVSKVNENFDFHSFVLSKFGRSLSISVEQSKPRLLPTSSLLSGNFSSDKRGSMFVAINETNSEELPASFVLHLDKPLVVSASILEKIHSTLENFKGEKFVQNSKAYMDCLIIKKWLKERNMEYSSQMAYRQKLPEEEHIYRISEKDLQGSLSLNSNVGVVISRIPFTHCQNVVKIIQLLRQQLVYNQILTSVFSSQTAQNNAAEEYSGPCFDVSTSSPFVVVITFEEPVTSSLASVEFQVRADCSIAVKFNPRKSVFYDCGYVSRVIQKCLSIPVTMKYIFKKARKIEANNEAPMVVDVDDTDSAFNQTPLLARHAPLQTSAYNLLTSMIASSGATSIRPGSNPGMVIPLLSPSPTLPNSIQTPSPGSNFPFVFQANQEKELEPFPAEEISAPSKGMEQQPQPPPTKPPPIRLKFKKVASNYIVETPKDNKQEPPPVIESIPAATQFAQLHSSAFDTGGFATDSNALLSNMPYQQATSVEQLVHSAPMDLLSPKSTPFSDADSSAFLSGPANTSVPGASRIADVDGIFQTLPGGATSSPGGLDVEDAYGFDTGLDPAFDIEAEIDAAGGVGSVTSDGSGFDFSNVYEPSASTSSTAAMTGSFDIDPTFDLDTLLASGSQSTDGPGLDWGLGSNGGADN